MKKARIKNNIGLVYKELNNLEKAIMCYRESIKFNEKRDQSASKDIDIARILNNIGDCYLDLGKTEKAKIRNVRVREGTDRCQADSSSGE